MISPDPNLIDIIKAIAQEEAAKAFKRAQNVTKLGQINFMTETDTTQKAQASLGKWQDIDLYSMQSYGFTSVLPKGSDVAIINIEGQSSAGVIIASNHQDSRPKNLKIGETQMHDNAQQYIYLQKGTTIVINAKEKITIKAPKGCDITVASGDEGVTIHGDLNVKGDVKVDKDVVAGTVSLKTHIHTNTQAGTGLSGAPKA